MIGIVGDGASGKSTLVDAFIAKNPDFHKLILYTTRPRREGEKSGSDYVFLGDEEFDDLLRGGFFANVSAYNNNWRYGIANADISGDTGKLIAVLTPASVRKLKSLGVKVMMIYLYVDREARMIRMIERGDTLEEAYRRVTCDYGQFDGVLDEADYVIFNNGYHMSVKEALVCLLKILQEDKTGSVNLL